MDPKARLTIVLEPAEAAALDRFRRTVNGAIPSKSEAARQLLALGLKAAASDLMVATMPRVLA